MYWVQPTTYRLQPIIDYHIRFVSLWIPVTSLLMLVVAGVSVTRVTVALSDNKHIAVEAAATHQARIAIACVEERISIVVLERRLIRRKDSKTKRKNVE